MFNIYNTLYGVSYNAINSYNHITTFYKPNLLPGTFDGTNYSSNLTYVVNQIPTSTKVFDNMVLTTTGTITDSMLYTMSFDTRSQHATTLPFTFNSSTGNFREDDMKLAIPRETTTGARLRGKYLITNMLLKPQVSNINVSIPYTTTTFRYSNI
jgi:hypothetical protein